MGVFSFVVHYVVPLLLCGWLYVATSTPFTGIVPFAHPMSYGMHESAIVSLAGQTALVTGATSGLGLGTAEHLARAGAHVIVTCRERSECRSCADAVARVRAAAADGGRGGRVSAVSLAMHSLDATRRAAADVRALLGNTTRLDMLVLNAGVMAPMALELTHDGIESQFGVNHVAHQLLVRELRPSLRAPGARVVVVSSLAHVFPVPTAGGVYTSLAEINDATHYAPDAYYGQSKLANALMGHRLARELASSRVSVHVVHPGGVRGKLLRHVLAPLHRVLAPSSVDVVENAVLDTMYWSERVGALTVVAAATDHGGAPEPGYAPYWLPIARRDAVPPSAQARDAANADRMWTFTERLLDELAPFKAYDYPRTCR